MIEIIVIKNGRDYNITNTALIQDYLKEKYIPEVDKLLDWRFYLMSEKKDCPFPKQWWEKEIIATDYLLSLSNKK